MRAENVHPNLATRGATLATDGHGYGTIFTHFAQATSTHQRAVSKRRRKDPALGMLG